MSKKKHNFFTNDNASVVFPSMSNLSKKKIAFFKIPETSRKLFDSLFKKIIFFEIFDFFSARSDVFFIALRDFSDSFVSRNFFQLTSSFSKTFFGVDPAFRGLGPLKIAYAKKMRKYDEKMIQIHFELLFFFWLLPLIFINKKILLLFLFFFSVPLFLGEALLENMTAAPSNQQCYLYRLQFPLRRTGAMGSISHVTQEKEIKYMVKTITDGANKLDPSHHQRLDKFEIKLDRIV